LQLPAHSADELSANELLGSFFDINYSYRFGPLAHDVTVATLKDAASGEVVATAFQFPQGYDLRTRDLQWQVRVEQVGSEWYLVIKTAALAISVHVADEKFRAEDNWFHLPANVERRVRLIPRLAGAAKPDGEVRALNSGQVGRYRS